MNLKQSTDDGFHSTLVNVIFGRCWLAFFRPTLVQAIFWSMSSRFFWPMSVNAIFLDDVGYEFFD